MEDIDISQEWLNYETRWVPNLDVLQQIAEHYQVDFIARYEEPVNWLNGEAVFTWGALQQFNLLRYDDESFANDSAYIALQELQAALLSEQQAKRHLAR